MATLKSSIWNDDSYEIAQGFLNRPSDPKLRKSYDYSAAYKDAQGNQLPAGVHIGVDVGMPQGTELYAGEAARVVAVTGSQAGGFYPNPVKTITLDDPNTPADEGGYVTIYGHMRSNKVNLGDVVKKGQDIGQSGYQTDPNTGARTSGDHLHLERRRGDRVLDPVAFAKNAGGYKEECTNLWEDNLGDATEATPTQIVGIPVKQIIDDLINKLLPGNPIDTKITKEEWIKQCIEAKRTETLIERGRDKVEDVAKGPLEAVNAFAQSIVASIGSFGKQLGIVIFAILLVGIGIWNLGGGAIVKGAARVVI